MRPRIGGRSGALNLGVLLLGYRILQTGIAYIPPTTLTLIGLQVSLFLGIISPSWSASGVCLSAYHVLQLGDYKRLVLAAIEHSGDMHLYFNMSSLLVKGRTLETRLGWRRFLLLVVWFTLSTSLCYVGVMEAAARFIHPSYRDQCAIGFSGVLFAMKVVTTYYASRGFEDRSSSWLLGLHISVPTRYAVWLELLVIHLLVPRSSFVGHLSGILIGLAYVTGDGESKLYAFDRCISNLFSFSVGDREYRSWQEQDDEQHPDPGYGHNYSQPQDQYRSYSREDFNPSRNFEPMFETRPRRRTEQTHTQSQAPSYTYTSGRPASDGHLPSAPPADEAYGLTQEEMRQQRLRRFQGTGT